MEILLLASVGFLFSMAAFIIWRILKLQREERTAHQRTAAILAMAEADRAAEAAERRNRPVVVGGQRRAQARRRIHHDESDQVLGAGIGMAAIDSDGEEEPLLRDDANADPSIGKKKLAKLQAKGEKNAQREAEVAEREDRKKREKEREDRDKKDQAERARDEEERKAAEKAEQEERERREHEEYLKMKAEFAVEEEGFDEVEKEESENIMRSFVDYIKKSKVVNMEELASQFNMRSEDAIDRLTHFINEGILTGVIDDRGKFVYITRDELNAVAKFINQRGRVPLTELAEYSNRLIDLESTEGKFAEEISS